MAERPNHPRPQRQRRGLRPVGAAELGEFVFCAKSWAFRRRYGNPNDPATLARLEAGRRTHAEEGWLRGEAEAAIRRGRWWWVWLLLAGLLLWWLAGRT